MSKSFLLDTNIILRFVRSEIFRDKFDKTYGLQTNNKLELLRLIHSISKIFLH